MARKSKAFGELLKQQRAEKGQQKGLKKLQQKIQKSPLGDKLAGMEINPKGEVKMSEVLEAFVEPYLDLTHDASQREKLFQLAVIAWNLALMPENKRQSAIDQFIEMAVKGNEPLAQQETREIIDELIARKHEFFAQYKRYIIDFDLEDTGTEFHLSVASTS